MPNNEKMDKLARDAFPSASRKEVLRSLASHIRSMRAKDPDLRKQFNKNEPLLKMARGIRDLNYDEGGIVGQHLQALKEYYKEKLKFLLGEAATQDTEPNPSGPPGSKYTREAPPMSPRDAYAHDATRARMRTAMSTAASRAINAGLTGKTPGSRPVYPQDDGNTIY